MKNWKWILMSLVLLIVTLLLVVSSCNDNDDDDRDDSLDDEYFGAKDTFCDDGTSEDLKRHNSTAKRTVDFEGESFYVLSCFQPEEYPSYLSDLAVTVANPDQIETTLAVFWSELPTSPTNGPLWESNPVTLPDMEPFKYYLKGFDELNVPIYSGSWCFGYKAQGTIKAVLDSSTTTDGRDIIGSPETGFGSIETWSGDISGKLMIQGASWICPYERFYGGSCYETKPRTIVLPANLPFYDYSATTCGENVSYFGKGCRGHEFDGEDVVYHIRVREKVNVRIEMDPKMVEGTLLGLHDGCPETAMCIERSAVDYHGKQMIESTLTPGEYFVLVTNKTYPGQDDENLSDEPCLAEFDLSIEWGN